MAGTVTLNYDLTVSNGSSKIGPTYSRQTIVQTNIGGPNVGTVTATTGGITLTPGVSTLGICEITNNDDTNFVKVGPVSGGTQYDFMKLKPGESYPIRLMPGITIGVKADTASCKVTFKIFED